MRKAESPLFVDPIYNGAADPTMIWNAAEQQWWMVYTQRKATLPAPGVAWVHGTDLGVSSSRDGHMWVYRGILQGLAFEPGRNTWWAPEIIFHEGTYHMYASYIQGMPFDWEHPRSIIHYTSKNLWDWKKESVLPFSSRVIDACVARLDNELWRMWYKDENDQSYSHFADSPDLYHWEPKGRSAIPDSHEGANVFFFKDTWWYIGDFWKGLGVFRSKDCLEWDFCGYILDKPGKRPGDSGIGHHADVVVKNEEAFIFYFTHLEEENKTESRFTAVHTARLKVEGKRLICDRDEEFDFSLEF